MHAVVLRRVHGSHVAIALHLRAQFKNCLDLTTWTSTMDFLVRQPAEDNEDICQDMVM